MQPPEEQPTMAPAPPASSRRKFLQGAALATATAAAATAGGIAIARSSNSNLKHAIQTFGNQTGQISGSKSGGCTTGTVSPYAPLTTPSTIHSKSGERQFMLWFWINNVPAGTYTLSIQVSGPGGTTVFPVPFYYSGFGSMHNYILGDNTATCPGTVPTPNGNGFDLARIQTVTLTGAGKSDILWQLHLNGVGVAAGVYTFTGTITDGSGNTQISTVTLTVVTP